VTDRKAIIEVLDGVDDPAGGGGVIATGRVSAPRVTGPGVTAVFNVDGLSPEQQAGLQVDIESALKTLPGIDEVRLVLTAERRRPRRMIAVASGKGGVGKSTIAANLAVALAAAGGKVGLIDADIHGPSVPTLFGTGGQRLRINEKKLVPIAAHGVRTVSVGHMLDPSQAIAWRGPMVGRALKQLIDDTEWGDTDTIILDLPPGTGDIQLSLAEKHRPDGVVIVSTPQDLAMIDARRAIDLFNQTGIPIVGIVENMSGYACPSCGHVSEPFGQGGVEETCAALGVPYLGRVPLDIAIRTASDEGRPVAGGSGPEGAAFHRIAQTVTAFIGD
jgi:ATP-binding protein involved in chromosome partitioning